MLTHIQPPPFLPYPPLLPLYFLGLLAGSILTLLFKGGLGTLAAGRDFGALAGFNPSTGLGLAPEIGTLGMPLTGALGSPPLVLGWLALLTLTFPGPARGLELTGGREDRGFELTGGREDSGLEFTGGRDLGAWMGVEGLRPEGLGSPLIEGDGLEASDLGFEAAEMVCFFAAPTAPDPGPVYGGRAFAFVPAEDRAFVAGAGRAFCADEGAAGSAFCFAPVLAGSAFFTAVGPLFVTAVLAFGAVAAIARSP